MRDHYSIGALAREADVPTSTLRYYERRGLLRAQSRTAGNYRVYDREALDRLRFICSSRLAGFTLTDIAALLRLRDGDMAPCREVQGLIETRLGRVHEELQRLTETEKLLRQWLRACRAAERTGRCGVLAGLSGRPEESREETEDSP